MMAKVVGISMRIHLAIFGFLVRSVSSASISVLRETPAELVAVTTQPGSPAYLRIEQAPGAFRTRQDVRCNEHFHVAGWGIDTEEQCQALCSVNERCASYSIQLSEDRGCYLYSTDSQCSHEAGWNSGHRDTKCGVAIENSATAVRCPFGSVISGVVFASYGTPTGKCYNFTTGSCHGESTKEVIEDLCLGENECVLSASDLVFGDPCAVVNKELKVQVECTVGNSFNEDIYFNAWSSRHWPTAISQTEVRKDDWKGFLEALPAYPAAKYSDRGIIVVAGGRYLEPALVMIKMLRQSGCNLRIQVWHVGKEEMRDVHRQLLQPYNVETRDFHDFVGDEMLKAIQANVGMRLFQLKPLALLHTDLEDVLLLDSDNCPLADPTYLFEEPEFKKTGTIFWPDYWKTSQQNPIWNIIGKPPENSWEQESGQLLLHKPSAWRAINLCVYFNSEFYMKLLNGDKDTFRFSWMAADVPYKMIETWPTPIGTLKELHSNEAGFCSHTMLQHDLQGNPLFVHHNQLKHASLENGQNFRFKKVPSDPSSHYRAVPVTGLQLTTGEVLPCIDVQGEGNPLIEGDKCSVSESGLRDFEQRYFDAQKSIPSDSFTAQERAAPSLLGSDAGKAAKMHRAFVEAQMPLSAQLMRDTNTTCKPTEFELVKPTLSMDRVCESVTTCTDGQKEAAAPTATSDRACFSLKPAPSKELTVRLNAEKSEKHPYFHQGATVAYAIKDDKSDDFVEAKTIHVTRLETYEFKMVDMPSTDPFILTLDALGGVSANAFLNGVDGSSATGHSSLFFTPGPSTPSTLYYQSQTNNRVGWKVLVSDPSFTRMHVGQHDDNTATPLRFSTAFSTQARMFTLTAQAGISKFVTLRESCEESCASQAACKGIFVYRTPMINTCYGLNDISGKGITTSTDSESVSKTTF
jgi:alpha 1,2-mannosyltransferase